jgi:hypothetical protein
MILEAVNRYTEQVAQTTEEEYPRLGLVNAESWIQLAKDMQKVIKG